MRHRPRIALAAIATLCALVSLAGCGIRIPADPHGTLTGVEGDELHVGVSPDPGLIDVSGATPTGALIDLAEDYARTLDATPTWTVASEETLVGMLESGDIDLAVGGFTEKTPWTARAALTRGYANIPGADGRKLVMLVPLGENAMLSDLERFLDEEVGS
ncbi:hypothetical protein [Microbacterium sp. USHLN186]|uniref:hypothetical protein n=1 Tax=Microbacterium sp. USHLN186 TaxID=3081286 RepID=UPI0030186733